MIGKAGAITRTAFSKGNAADLIQWASYSPKRTQFFIKHVLTGPNLGQAIADLYRWYSGAGPEEPEDVNAPPAPTGGTSTVRTASASPPPQPQALR